MNKISKKEILVFSSLFILTIVLSGCANQPHPSIYNPPGFLMGALHGLTMGFSFIGSIFMDDIRMYAFPNSGVMYDLGYIIGAIPGLSVFVIFLLSMFD